VNVVSIVQNLLLGPPPKVVCVPRPETNMKSCECQTCQDKVSPDAEDPLAHDNLGTKVLAHNILSTRRVS
jgi:hypothetical protein